MPELLKALIIGGRSMIGSRLAARLNSDFLVKTAGRHPDNDFWFDLSENSLSEELAQSKFDIIIHCGANFADNTLAGFLENQRINTCGALQVVRLLEETNCPRLIYLSSIFVYDHPDNGYYGSYGLSKRHAQETLALYCRLHGFNMTALLLSQIYDEAGEAKKHQPFIYRILETASKNEELTLYGNRSPKRNLLFVDDVTHIIQKAIENNAIGIFDCIHPQSHSLEEIAKIAFNTFGYEPKIIRDKAKPNPPSTFIPDDFSIYQQIDYFPETSLEEGFYKYKLYTEATKA